MCDESVVPVVEEFPDIPGFVPLEVELALRLVPHEARAIAIAAITIKFFKSFIDQVLELIIINTALILPVICFTFVL